MKPGWRHRVRLAGATAQSRQTPLQRVAQRSSGLPSSAARAAAIVHELARSEWLQLRRTHLRVGRLAATPLRPFLEAIWTIVIAWELWLEGVADRRALGGCFDDEGLDELLTVVVKTYERPDVSARFVASVRRLYPRLPVIVVDDSRHPVVIDDPLTETVVLPFDSGLSAGRNEGVRRVRTPYVLIADDDHVLCRRTRLRESLAALRDKRIDIVGGRVLNLPHYRSDEYHLRGLYPGAAPPLMPRGTLVTGFPVCDVVENFFVARTDALRRVPWDERLRMLEHTDFFSQASGTLLTVYDASLCCLHAPTPFRQRYMEGRDRLGPAQAVLQEKWRRPGASRSQERPHA